jgi:hypothetical protein
MKKEIYYLFYYDLDIILDNSYPLNILNFILITGIKILFRFKKFRHALIMATILMLNILYNTNSILLLLNYTLKNINIENRDFAGIQNITLKEINIFFYLLLYKMFKEISLVDDVIIYDNLYILKYNIKNNFKKRIELSIKYNTNIISFVYFKQYFNKYKKIYFSNIKLNQFYISMRYVMSFFYILFDWYIFYYLFDKDLYFKEYGAIFQLIIINNLWAKYKNIFLSYLLLLNINYKL